MFGIRKSLVGKLGIKEEFIGNVWDQEVFSGNVWDQKFSGNVLDHVIRTTGRQKVVHTMFEVTRGRTGCLFRTQTITTLLLGPVTPDRCPILRGNHLHPRRTQGPL